jgi:hypothetical protein
MAEEINPTYEAFVSDISAGKTTGLVTGVDNEP